MNSSIARLLGGTLLVWAIVFWPARWLGGSEVSGPSLAACLLCLTPAVVTLAWARRALGGKPEQQLTAVLGGMLLRMIVVFSGGLALFFTIPALHSAAFWIWVLGFYLLTLILEMTLLLTDLNRGGEPLEQASPPKGQAAADTLSAEALGRSWQ